MSQTKVQLINNVSGDSGFGTSSPAEKLVVNGAIVASGAVSDPSSYTDTGLYVQNKGSSVFDVAAWRSGASVAELSFSTDSGSDAAPIERMRIDSSGNVGIGDANPDALLHVGTGTNSDGTDVEIHIGGNATNTRKSMIKKLIQTDDRALQIHAATGSSDEDIRFFSDGSTERMRILHDGAVVVNATARPVVGTEFLGVQGGSASNAVGIGSAVSHKSGIPFFASNSSNTTSQRLMRFAAGSGGDTRGTITFNGSSLVYGTSSDYRLKKNVQQISNGITKLKALKPIIFDWIKETDKNNVMGFLAHEVQEVIPQVITGEKDEVETTYYIEGDTIPDGKKIGDVKDTNVPVYQEMDYGALTPLLTAALQEEISKREALEVRVAALEAKG